MEINRDRTCAIKEDYDNHFLYLTAHLLIFLQEAQKLNLEVKDYVNTFISRDDTGIMKLVYEEGKKPLSFLVTSTQFRMRSGRVGYLYVYNEDMPIEDWSSIESTDVLAHVDE